MLLQIILFFILITTNIKVLLIIHTKFQSNIPTRSGKNADFISLVIYSIGGHLEFLTRLNFTSLKSWESDRAAYGIRDLWMQGFKKLSHLNGLDLTARVDINCGWT